MGVNFKCGVQSKRKCGSHESCVCIVGFPHGESTIVENTRARGDLENMKLNGLEREIAGRR